MLPRTYTTVQSHSTAECPEKPVEFWTSEKREVVEKFWLFSDDLIRKKITVSASIDLRRSIKKLDFYGEILLNKMLSN